MPLISSFYGILIKMYFKDNERHHLPHFHAKYQNFNAVFDLEGNRIEGTFPPSKEKYVSVWADIHNEELKALWDLMVSSEDYFKIKGLDE